LHRVFSSTTEVLQVTEDKNLTCRQCGREFAFTQGEQEFYRRKGLTSPSRCPECRSAKQIQPQPLICSQCKTELDKGTSICCTACLASVHLQTQLEIRQSLKAADEAQSKLRDSESEKANLAEALGQKERVIIQLKKDIDTLDQDLMEAKEAESKLLVVQSREAELAESLSHKEHAIAELENRLRSLSQELEKLRQFHTDLQWIHPAVDGIRERLEALEHGQNKTNQRMLQVVERMHELYENTGILGMVKRIFGRYQNQAAHSK